MIQLFMLGALNAERKSGFPPSSGSMKPKPRAGFQNSTLPVGIPSLSYLFSLRLILPRIPSRQRRIPQFTLIKTADGHNLALLLDFKQPATLDTATGVLTDGRLLRPPGFRKRRHPCVPFRLDSQQRLLSPQDC